MLSYLPHILPPNTITLGLSFQHMNEGEGGNTKIQFIANFFLILSIIKTY